ncbi:MAG: hypothetical protein D6729_12915, partial [Deltaproteobacteria bacterium]
MRKLGNYSRHRGRRAALTHLVASLALVAGACGQTPPKNEVPDSTFEVNAEVAPRVATVPGLDGGPERPGVAMRDATG